VLGCGDIARGRAIPESFNGLVSCEGSLCFPRGAVECIRSLSQRQPGETLSAQETLRLTDACHALGAAAGELTKLGHEEQAAQARLEHGTGLRSLRMTRRCSVYWTAFICTCTGVMI